ncbi:MAG: hypothetical protein FWG10_14535 [Eubacteriaceae bacterium]|nr:hypothetical protein [Eubacteriaceae bacterium]
MKKSTNLMLFGIAFSVIVGGGNGLYVEFGKGVLQKPLFALGPFDITIYAILCAVVGVSYVALWGAYTDALWREPYEP